MSRTTLLLKNVTLALTAAALTAMTTGCAMTNDAVTETPGGMTSGVVHGGQSPIQGATVTMYSTTSNGYGAAGTLIGSATTDVNGNFTISPSVTGTTCPSGQYAYIIASAGYPSGSPGLNNTSSLMAAAVNPCSLVTSSTHVVINEASTVAFGYAWGNFTTTSAVSGGYTANVGAPAANNAGLGSATLTAASGLGHAGYNAAQLVALNGVPNATITASVGGTAVSGLIPVAEINTLADILAACVNGATGNASCTTLFGVAKSISGATPTNTLQAMIYLARNPYPSAAAMNQSTGLFSLVAASGSPFVPTLTAVPPDWALAVVYTNATALLAQYFTALDAQDTIYGGRSATANLQALSAYGISTPAFTAGTGSATRQIAPDILGNVWVSNNATILYQYSAGSGGAPSTFATVTSADLYGVAVDKNNNLWVGNAVTTTPNITEYAFSAGPTYTANYTATAPGGFEPVWLTIDGKQNVWLADYFTNGTVAGVLANLTPAGTATYTSAGTTITPVPATFASNAAKPIGVVADASGNAWFGITSSDVGGTITSNAPAVTGIEEVIPTLTSSVITSLTSQSEIDGTTLNDYASGAPSIDGAGVIFIPDNFSTTAATALGVHAYSTQVVTSSNTGGQVLSEPSGYLGCYLVTSATTTCGPVGTNTFNTATYNPRTTNVDSTGSVWAGITTGGFTQFIGLGAPSWPLAQTDKPGVEPGLSTAATLP